MLRLPTVMLLHESGDGRHFDWLLGDPAESRSADRRDARLWTGRVAWPTWAWEQAGQWLFEATFPHRRRYLTYQGPLTGGRGRVRRVDEGVVTAMLWTADRRIIAVQMRFFQGLVEMQRLDGSRWRAVSRAGGGATDGT